MRHSQNWSMSNRNQQPSGFNITFQQGDILISLMSNAIELNAALSLRITPQGQLSTVDMSRETN